MINQFFKLKIYAINSATADWPKHVLGDNTICFLTKKKFFSNIFFIFVFIFLIFTFQIFDSDGNCPILTDRLKAVRKIYGRRCRVFFHFYLCWFSIFSCYGKFMADAATFFLHPYAHMLICSYARMLVWV